MQRGRPPVWNPFGGARWHAWTEVATLEGRGRVVLSASLRNCLSWMSPFPGAGLLARIDSDARAELLPWAPRGEQVVSALAKRLDGLAEPERGNLAVTLADTYFKLSFERPGRLTLPAAFRSFLLTPGRTEVRLVAVHDQLWAWNEESWQAQRGVRAHMAGGS